MRFIIKFNIPSLLAQKNKSEILKKISTIIDNGQFLNGRENKSLKKNLAKYLPGGYIVNTASGHDAIYLALKSLNLNSDDEVIFPVNSYPTAFPVILSGAKPVPIDIDENGQINPEEVKKKINSKTKVLILVHLYGLIGKIDEIKEIIKSKEIILIEDCAQSFGACYNKQPVGTLGDIACFSFYPTKNLATLGDGGAIWTKNKTTFNYLEKAIRYGEEKKYKSEFLSGHSRLPEIQAGVLNVYIDKFPQILKKRKYLYQTYCREFKKKNLEKYIRVLITNSKSTSAPHLFIIETIKRNKLQKYLKRKGVETYIHYPYSPHLIPAFSLLNNKKGDFIMAERLSKSIISLPFHPFLTKKDIVYIVCKIKDFYESIK